MVSPVEVGVQLTAVHSHSERNGAEQQQFTRITDILSYKQEPQLQAVSATTEIFLPGTPLIVQSVDAAPVEAGGRLCLRICMEHGPFEWNVYATYSEILALRRALQPLRERLKVQHIRNRRRHGHVHLPHLFDAKDLNPFGRYRVPNQASKVQRFLNAIVREKQFRNRKATLDFLEISRCSFVEDLGNKYKESSVKKRSGGYRHVTNCLGCTACFVCRCSVWRSRWLILKEGFIMYIKPTTREICGVLLFASGTYIEAGVLQTGLQHGLKIVTPTRELLVRCESHTDMKEWRAAIKAVLEGPARSLVKQHRFDSFAPVRSNCQTQWYVDGQSYMSAVADAILKAKEEIYITDWMMSPHIYLKRSKRGVKNCLRWRLDRLLLKKAREGVRVYIQLYKELTLAVELGSEFTHSTLNHPNIVVLRHPDHFSTGVFLWSHHEKLVVIDQTLAFVGGIDLAFGRWDSSDHHLSDPHQAVDHQSFIQGAISTLVHNIATLNVTAEDPRLDQDSDSSDEDVDGAKPQFQFWAGKDYYNPFVKDFISLHEPYEDLLTREEHPRMPWHDISCCVYGEPARDVARHFIQRFNFTKREQELSLPIPFLLPRKQFSEAELDSTSYLHIPDPASSTCTCQVLRSVSRWSAAVENTEHSIMNAYLHYIENAKHFIYIENQFFISSVPGVKNCIAEAIRKRIGRAHKEGKTFRVIIVLPLLPSYGGEFGDSSATVKAAVFHWIVSTLYQSSDSLIRQLTSVEGVPECEVQKYISVHGLRAYGEIDQKLVTELIYVHSKLMIVDDRMTIIGSSNVNDRSMLGDRDSEMAVIFEDKEMMEGRMNGESFSVGKFSHTLRCHLFREFLGMSDQPADCVSDPVSDDFYNDTWIKAASNNSRIFQQVFGGRIIPTDEVHDYTTLQSYKEVKGLVDTDPSSAREELSLLKGTLVFMPLRFLENEELAPDFGTPESFAPQGLFT